MGAGLQRDPKVEATEKEASSWNAGVRQVVVGVVGATTNTTALAFARRFVLNICEKLQHVFPKVTLHRAAADLEFYWKAGGLLRQAVLTRVQAFAGGVEDAGL